VSQLYKGLDLLAKLPEGPEPLRHELQLRVALHWAPRPEDEQGSWQHG
jgi:hypothetical protein